MHHNYADIRSRIEGKPIWFDEDGVPRYCKFAPKRCSNIYARQCLLMSISCQRCQQPFLVAMSWNMMPRLSASGEMKFVPSLSELVREGKVHYGDPPNVDCCGSGPSMSSVPHHVVEFWQRDDSHEWERVPQLERPIDCEWYQRAEDDDES